VNETVPNKHISASVHRQAPMTMVLAAGFGKRMLPLTQDRPKPLVRIGGRALLDHALDRIAEAGLPRAIVNIHHLGEQIVQHLDRRVQPLVIISDEREAILETGGGVRKALPLLGNAPFLVFNADSLWIERESCALHQLQETWNPQSMDALLLLAEQRTSLGYDGKGDFLWEKPGNTKMGTEEISTEEISTEKISTEGTHKLRRRTGEEDAPFIYAGVAMLKPCLFTESPEGAFSLNRIFDSALNLGRLYGVILSGDWLHVGTVDAIAEAEQRLIEP
jgi:N-acetyl-alpha-D-muramate 1-phosphate uridylyltransferase